ncbi:MAG: hypothetical protein U0905_04985 [Pirellulales bacterium]
MKNRKSKLFAIAMVAFASQAASAGWPEFWHSCGVDRERNNIWPHPFRSADAGAVYAPFDVMKANGWKLYNTLGTGFFTEQNALTDAGRIRLEWIISQAPVDRRQVFVLKGATGDDTAARVESVQVAISQLLPVGELPPIYVTDVEPYVSSGQYQTAINRALIRTTPNPRLPVFKGLNTPSSNSGSGGGAGAGGSSGGSK